MKNIDKWQPVRFRKNNKGKIASGHMERIIGSAYGKVIKCYAKGRLADVGCGDVPFYHFYHDLITENICIDWPHSTLDLQFADIEADLNESLTLESSSFDTVLCTDVLEHISKPYTLFSEMERILKPNGHLILGVPFMYWIHSNPDDYHRYTHFMLREFCKQNKLEVIELNTYGGLPEIIYDLIYRGYGYYNLPLKKLFLFIWENVGTFLAKRKFIQRLSKSSYPTFPLGYVLVARKRKLEITNTGPQHIREGV